MALSYCILLIGILLCCNNALLIHQVDSGKDILYDHAVGVFGPQDDYEVETLIIIANPKLLCNGGLPMNSSGNIVLIMRGGGGANCTFYNKALVAQKAGAVGVVIGNDPSQGDSIIRMSMPLGLDDQITIPSVFIAYSDYANIAWLIENNNGSIGARLNKMGEIEFITDNDNSAMRFAGYFLLILPSLWCILACGWTIRKWIVDRRNRQIRTNFAQRIPVITYRKPQVDEAQTEQKASERIHNEACAICLEDFIDSTRIKRLPCGHGFHIVCIDPWLNDRSDLCPICKVSILDFPSAENKRCCAWCCCNSGYRNLA
jgi:hypothetical protein